MQEASDDVRRAVSLLEGNLQLLTGHEPGRLRLVTGHSRVHRVALTWPTPERPQVCLQVLLDPARPAEPGADAPPAGWRAADAGAIAESLDLRLRFDSAETRVGGFSEWRRGTGPAYHLVLLDAGSSSHRDADLSRRCAALEASYLSSAGWLRFYADGRFAEGSFTRVLERAAYDVRGRLGSPTPPPSHSRTHRGVC